MSAIFAFESVQLWTCLRSTFFRETSLAADAARNDQMNKFLRRNRHVVDGICMRNAQSIADELVQLLLRPRDFLVPVDLT